MWRLKGILAAGVFLSATCGSAARAQLGLLLGLGRSCLRGRCETVTAPCGLRHMEARCKS